jgi:hypothetical protein
MRKHLPQRRSQGGRPDGKSNLLKVHKVFLLP